MADGQRTWISSIREATRVLSPAWYAGGDLSLAARLRDRQLKELVAFLPYTMPGGVLCALLVWIMFRREAPPLPLGAWFAAFFTVAASWLRSWWVDRLAGNSRRTTNADFLVAIYHASALALLYAAMSQWLYRHANADGRFVIAVLTAGALPVGAFAMANVPAAGLTWIGIIGTSAAYSLVSVGTTADLVVLVLLSVYVPVLVASVFSTAQAFCELVASEMESEQQHQVLGLLLQDFESDASDWLWETDPAGHLTRVPARLATALGCAASDLVSRSLVEVLAGTLPSPDDEELDALANARRRFAGASGFRDLAVPVRAEGRPCWWALSARPMLADDGTLTGWRGVGRDVTLSRKRDAEMERLANHDPLTGLPSRHRFHAVLRDRLEPDDRAYRFALLLIDIDNFKSVNDTLGQVIGDQLLRALAERLRERVGADDLIARTGGNEFALLSLSDGAGPMELWRRAEALLESLREPFRIGGIRIEARASIGVAVAPDDAIHPDDLVRKADLALRAAKEGGRDTVRLFDLEMDARARRRAVVLNDLGNAIESGQFSLTFQPQVELGSGLLCGFETLLSWNHPSHGLVPPELFVPIAEETGIIVPIGAWILEQACMEAHRWPVDAIVSVNLSAVQFRSSALIGQVAEALTPSGLPPDRLELEITETALVTDHVGTRNTLQALRRMRVRIAVDDFGTGYSSLAYLQAFPIDKLKVDRLFVTALDGENPAQARAILKAILNLAMALGLETTAEGVETEDQALLLRDLGCDGIQGFFVARPIDRSAVLEFCSNWRTLALPERLATLPGPGTS
jgi:diguanylate cyclase (GGDEF)-like protein/PAS domain S-box-containing protein